MHREEVNELEDESVDLEGCFDLSVSRLITLLGEPFRVQPSTAVISAACDNSTHSPPNDHVNTFVYHPDGDWRLGPPYT